MSTEEGSDSDQELFPISDQTAAFAFDYEDPLLVAGLLGAVVQGDLDKVKTLISEGRSPNINDNNGNTPLHLAVIGNKPEIVEFLLSLEETCINSRNFCGETALFHAVRRSNLQLVEKLIKANCNVNLPDLQEITPLHLSVSNPEIAHALIRSGANLNALDYSGETPLHEAVSVSCIETICVLLYFNADVNIKCNRNITPFVKSIIQENVEIQQILLDYVVDFNTTMQGGMTLLSSALAFTCPYVETIIERGADVNYKHKTFNSFRMCLRSPNVDKFRLIWKNFKYQESTTDYLSMLFSSLDESDIYQYLRVIIDSNNLQPIFEGFNLRSCYDLIIRSNDRKIWFNIMYELVFLYLCHGYVLTEDIISVLYELFGYNELFSICLHMDIEYSNNHCDMDYILCLPALTMDVIKRDLITDAEAESIKNFLPHMRFGGIESHFGTTAKAETLLMQIPSLLELARNATRDSLVKKFKLYKPKQYFSFIHHMPMPKVIKDYLTFRKPIYAVEME